MAQVPPHSKPRQAEECVLCHQHDNIRNGIVSCAVVTHWVRGPKENPRQTKSVQDDVVDWSLPICLSCHTDQYAGILKERVRSQIDELATSLLGIVVVGGGSIWLVSSRESGPIPSSSRIFWAVESIIMTCGFGALVFIALRVPLILIRLFKAKANKKHFQKTHTIDNSEGIPALEALGKRILSQLRWKDGATVERMPRELFPLPVPNETPPHDNDEADAPPYKYASHNYHIIGSHVCA